MPKRATSGVLLSMVFAGSGGPPPSVARRSGGTPHGQKPYRFNFKEVLPSGKEKKVGLFRVDAGEKNVPFVFLDEALPDVGAAPSVRLHHGFKYNGTFGHTLLCGAHRETGCPLDIVFQRENKFSGKVEPYRGVWRWVATGIKMKPFTFTKGKLAGKTVPYQRCMLLVPDSQYDDFMEYREEFEDKGGLRGQVFHVRRKDDPKSSRIGTTWRPVESMTDEEMMEKFEEVAADYGLPVEQFIRPYDYEHVLKVPSDEELMTAARWIAGDMGLDLNSLLVGGTPSEETEAVSSTASTVEGDEDEVPF